ncbi:MAG TPA: SDR family NAD(P)-dependent oxidoreductase [Sporichthyaceae bacterium]|jgi:NAD(P)-dependent dehydrogenase (short-subunit alcohol dehydrogenase family)
MSLDEKVAVITGGTGGIGFGIARAFVDAGAKVLVTGRDVERGEKAVAELGGESRAGFFGGDAMDQAAVEACIDRAVDVFGRLDILVNNSGGATQFGLVADLPDSAWEQAIRWNLTSPFWACRRALKYLVPQRSGRIINISSVEGKHGRPGIAQYVAAKHGVIGLTKALAQEVGTLGITVNAICPGLVMTPLIRAQSAGPAALQNMSPEEFLQGYADDAAIKRFITTEEVGAMAVLIASDAGSGITGAALSVDGGTAGY